MVQVTTDGMVMGISGVVYRDKLAADLLVSAMAGFCRTTFPARSDAEIERSLMHAPAACVCLADALIAELAKGKQGSEPQED